MSHINENNYIVIQSFMVQELGLKGNELIVYAIIFGFSQTGNHCYKGSLQYLADWTNSTKQGVLKNLKSLLEKELIVKEVKDINGVNIVEYHTTKFNGVLNKVEQTVKQSLPNNIIINKNINNKEKFYISFPLKDSTEYDIFPSEVETYKELYSAIDVEQEMRNMKGWLIANPTKRKTKTGIKRFINNWLSNSNKVALDKEKENQKNKVNTYDEFPVFDFEGM